MATTYTAVNAAVLKLTAKAALLMLVDEERDRWVPRSLIEDGDKLEECEEPCDLHIETWFCIKEGIIDA